MVAKKSVLKTSSDLSAWNNACFFIKCRVTFGLRWCRKLRLIMGFKSCIWDIQYQLLKKQFFIFRKRGLRRFGLCTFLLKVSVQIFEKCRPMSPKPDKMPLKMTLRAAQSRRFELCLACFSSGDWKRCSEKFDRLMFVNTYFCSTAVLGFACASFWRLRLVLWFFTSCVWGVLRYRILIKTAFDFFGNVVFVVLYCMHLFWWF